MFILKTIGAIFLFPGNLALSMAGVSLEQDGGVFRSLINMIVWGMVGAAIVLPMVM